MLLSNDNQSSLQKEMGSLTWLSGHKEQYCSKVSGQFKTAIKTAILMYKKLKQIEFQDTRIDLGSEFEFLRFKKLGCLNVHHSKGFKETIPLIVIS